MTRHSLAIATCVALPEPDPDQDLMLAELAAVGIDATLAAWDDDSIDWASFDLCVLRSTWNYYDDLGRFEDWLSRASDATMLVNPAAVVRWNIHKRYLRDLAAAGLPIVPTQFVERGSDASLGALLAVRGWSDIVIKPCVSAGSSRTRRYTDGASAEAAAFLRSISDVDDAMIQPFIASVAEGGERSAVWIGGEATHAIVKQPRFDADDESVSHAKPVTDTERDMIDRCLAVAGDGLLYARLDTMRGDDGTLLISELELIEPSLFLLQSKAATDQFVASIAALLG